LKMMLEQRKIRGISAGALARVCRRVVRTPVDSAVCRGARGMSHPCVVAESDVIHTMIPMD
jgi:3-hydroxyisobutyrate dehydrogenase-like beta-hydroxyacid dehydrogenase